MKPLPLIFSAGRGACRCLHALTLSLLIGASSPSRAVEPEGFPKAGEPRHAEIAPVQEKILENGMRVIAAVRPQLPIFVAEVIVKSGAEADPPKLAGLAHLTADLLSQGTATRSAPQIASEIEALGAKLETEAHWDAATIKLTGLSEYTAPAFAILADVIRNPVFAKEEVERMRRQVLDQLRLALEAPGTVARYAAMRVALGQSPYAHPDAGTLGSLARIARKDIIALHDREYRPGNVLLVVSGPLPAGDIFALAEKVFGDWKESHAEAPVPAASATSAAPASPATATPSKPRSVLIDMPNAGQAAVFLACSSIPRTAADYYAGKVANALLGGGYSSRLNQEVRVKRGLSYGAGSAIDTHRSTGLFLASAQTKNESAAEVVSVMRTEVARLGTEAAPADYLSTRKAVLTGAFARDLETNDGYVKRLGELAIYGLPLDTMDHTVANIESVDAEALRAFAEHHLPASALNVVIAGNAKQAAEPLRKLIPEIEIIPQAALDFDSVSLKKTGKK